MMKTSVTIKVNISEKEIESNFVSTENEGCCSAEFPQGCILPDEFSDQPESKRIISKATAEKDTNEIMKKAKTPIREALAPKSENKILNEAGQAEDENEIGEAPDAKEIYEIPNEAGCSAEFSQGCIFNG